MVANLQSLPYIIAVLVMISVAIATLRFYRHSFVTFAIPALILGQIVWTLAYVFELSSTTLETKLLWDNLQIIGMLFAGWTLVAFSLVYSALLPAGYWKPWIFVIVTQLPLEIALFAKPEWFRLEPHLVADVPTAALHFSTGPGLVIIFIIIWLLNLSSISLILQCVLRAHRYYHIQSALILTSIVIPFAASLVFRFIIKLGPNQDFVPLTLIASDLLILIGLRRYRLLLFLPIARDAMFDRMSDPVLVLNPSGQVIDINKAALDLIGMSEWDAIGRPIHQILPAFPDSTDPRRKTGAGNFDIFITSRQNEGHYNPELDLTDRLKVSTYNLSISPLMYWRSQLYGMLLIMRDISDQRRAQDGLREAHDNLEQHVRERTHLLNQTVDNLSREIDDRIRAERTKERYVTRMEILHGIDRAILQAKTPGENAAVALAAIRPLVPYDRACVTVNNTDSPGVRILASVGSTDAYPTQTGYANAPAAEIKALGARRTAYIGDLAKDPGAHPMCDHCLANQVNTLFFVPLVYQNKPIGAIHFCSVHAYALSQEQTEISLEIADQLAIAIQQANLLEDTRRQVRELAALNQIARSITSDLELGEAVQSLLRQSVELVGADSAFLAIIDIDTCELHLDSSYIFSPDYPLPPLKAGEGITWQTYQANQAMLVEDYAGHSHALPAWIDAGLISAISTPVTAGEYRVGVLNLCSFHHEKRFNLHNLELARMVASQAGLAIRNVQLYNSAQAAAREIASAYDATIQGWALALELREKETAGHSHRVVSLTLAFASVMHFTPEQLIHVHRGALLHDIGKMGIPDAILLKPGPLTDDEWEIMRQHPSYAYRLLADIPYLRPALDIPYSHHEHWDGSGYPRGLKGDEIPLAARIFTIIDVWDALRSDRPYRPAWFPARVQEYLLEKSGSLFDPHLVPVFLELLKESEELK